MIVKEHELAKRVFHIDLIHDNELARYEKHIESLVTYVSRVNMYVPSEGIHISHILEGQDFLIPMSDDFVFSKNKEVKKRNLTRLIIKVIECTLSTNGEKENKLVSSNLHLPENIDQILNEIANKKIPKRGISTLLMNQKTYNLHFSNSEFKDKVFIEPLVAKSIFYALDKPEYIGVIPCRENTYGMATVHYRGIHKVKIKEKRV